MTDIELIYDYLDDKLDETQLAEFEKRLTEDAEFARMLAEAGRQDVLIGDFFEESSKLESVEKSDTSKIWQFPKWGYAVASVAAIIVLCFLIFFTPDPGPPLQWLQAGTTREIPISQIVRENLTIDEPDQSSLSFPDGTQIQLSKVKATLKKANDGWLLEVMEGKVECTVAKQPKGQKFVVRTQDIEVKVVGTKFQVDVQETETMVAVDEGKVAVAAPAGEEVLVTAGQEVTVLPSKSGPPKIFHEQVIWSANPDNHQFPEDCVTGDIVSDDQKGLVFEGQSVEPNGILRSSCSVGFKDDKNGLFKYEKDLILECEYYLGRRGHWLGFWMRGNTTRHTYYESIVPPKYDSWQKARIPLADLKSQIEGEGPPQPGEKIKHLMIMTESHPATGVLLKNIRVKKAVAGNR